MTLLRTPWRCWLGAALLCGLVIGTQPALASSSAPITPVAFEPHARAAAGYDDSFDIFLLRALAVALVIFMGLMVGGAVGAGTKLRFAAVLMGFGVTTEMALILNLSLVPATLLGAVAGFFAPAVGRTMLRDAGEDDSALGYSSSRHHDLENEHGDRDDSGEWDDDGGSDDGGGSGDGGD